MAKSNISNIDWVSVLLFLVLVTFGWINIYSASLDDSATSFFDLSQSYGKQALWIGLSFVMIILILATEAKFFERFSGVIFVISILSLLGLFVFGKTISGATSWYVFGPVSIQPSEFAKAATGLALAKYISDIQTNIKSWKHQLRAFFIIALPALIIIPQPDPGSAIVYVAFLFALYREGITGMYFVIGISTITLFILTLLFGPELVLYVILFLLIVFYLIHKTSKKVSVFFILLLGIFAAAYFYESYSILIISLLFIPLGFYLINTIKKGVLPKMIAGYLIIAAFSFSVNYIFYSVFEQRHRDRFNIVLGKEVDTKGIGYNTNQSEIAIGSGGWLGKGWTQGTQTKGNFVPEQHTDYIFSTIGEEWGFLGSLLFIIVFISLLLRILYLAERQKSQFNRVYGYSVAGILFLHFFINMGMVIGLLPTVGIPLPFFSYGGSGLWGFTILLFIFIKLDSDRMNS